MDHTKTRKPRKSAETKQRDEKKTGKKKKENMSYMYKARENSHDEVINRFWFALSSMVEIAVRFSV